MIKKVSRNEMRKVRHTRIRENLSGTSERPRLCVFRSNANIEAQIIDDVKGVTLVSASSLEKELNLPVHLMDERLTTKQATDLLISNDTSRKKRKQVIDAMAATIILQSYLDKERNNG